MENINPQIYEIYLVIEIGCLLDVLHRHTVPTDMSAHNLLYMSLVNQTFISDQNLLSQPYFCFLLNIS